MERTRERLLFDKHDFYRAVLPRPEPILQIYALRAPSEANCQLQKKRSGPPGQ
jgi:hypothetical protein